MNKNIKNVAEVDNLLQQSITLSQEKARRFFKTNQGEYAQHDQFLGITTPRLRAIAKSYKNLSLREIEPLLQSPYNEQRLLALFILINQYKANKQIIFDFYLQHLNRVNNWNLVDSSAHLIIGAHLQNQPKDLLLKLSKSNNLWHRRIAIVATWHFIRNNQIEQTFLLAQELLNEKQDLIHKAVGWMLREAGKKNEPSLLNFLNKHAQHMPRTMLRYSLEKLSPDQKKYYLTKTGLTNT